ncbi:MAG: enoyl-CoA hydratase [Acidimicrobiia bacterium]
MSDEVIRTETAGGVRTITLNRPQARNALSAELIARLAETLLVAEDDAGVAAVVLTGADPAFCAGLDLREVGSSGMSLGAVTDLKASPWLVLAGMDTAVVGAVNGPAVTGGLELALQCSFLVASERAVFADTHARVGIHPGGGLTGLLPQAVGLRRAREMSFTGRFVGAEEAARIGLVNHVVPHQQLVPFAQRLAAEIATLDPAAVQAINATYRDVAATTLGEGFELERRRFADWKLTPADVESRRQAIIDRGRSKLG